MRVALGISYRGFRYHGWQSQAGGGTVQDELETALAAFVAQPIRTTCAGRTDAGVHGINQVVHFDSPVERDPFSWIRGVNRYLPNDIAVQWARPVSDDFHSRFAAKGRRYAYVLLESPARPSVEAGMVGWSFRPLDGERMRHACAALIGEHDFSAFRSAHCQARTPVKTLRSLSIDRRGRYWRFDFEASAFLHHMVRNLMGSVLAVGNGSRPVEWLGEVLASRNRALAARTFPADGLYFVGPHYDAVHAIPEDSPAFDWLP
jgi:tRNA pseudouridine38-40 synthase